MALKLICLFGTLVKKSMESPSFYNNEQRHLVFNYALTAIPDLIRWLSSVCPLKKSEQKFVPVLKSFQKSKGSYIEEWSLNRLKLRFLLFLAIVHFLLTVFVVLNVGFFFVYLRPCRSLGDFLTKREQQDRIVVKLKFDKNWGSQSRWRSSQVHTRLYLETKWMWKQRFNIFVLWAQSGVTNRGFFTKK